MKRVILCALLGVALLITLCGCEGGLLAQKMPDVNKTYRFTAELETADGELTADFLRNNVNDWAIDFTAPFSVADLTLQVRNGEGLATFDMVEAQMDAKSWNSSALNAFIQALECAANDTEGIAVTKTSAGIQATGKSQDMTYVLVFDEAGLPCSLKIDAIGLTAVLSAVEILGDIQRTDVIAVR